MCLWTHTHTQQKYIFLSQMKDDEGLTRSLLQDTKYCSHTVRIRPQKIARTFYIYSASLSLVLNAKLLFIHQTSLRLQVARFQFYSTTKHPSYQPKLFSGSATESGTELLLAKINLHCKVCCINLSPIVYIPQKQSDSLINKCNGIQNLE